jgi:hypothetical protein
MRLLTFNVNDSLVEALSKEHDITNLQPELGNFPVGDVLLMDYLPKIPINQIGATALRARQAEILKHYSNKKLPTILYDKFVSITQEEINWLRKTNRDGLFMIDPTLRHRMGAIYLPVWVKMRELNDIKYDVHERSIFLGYKGRMDTKIKTFEKYNVEFGKNYPTMVNKYEAVIPKEKQDEYINSNVYYDPTITYNDIQLVIALGTNKDYDNGYLDPEIFEALYNNVIVLLPVEHKYFHSMFADTVIKSFKDIYFYNIYYITYVGFILEVYKRIEAYFPEFKFNNTLDVYRYLLGSIK